jgi:hypothetical protein
VTNIYFLSNLAQLFLEREVLQTKAVEKLKTHIFLFNNFFFFENVEMCGRSGQATDDNMAQAHCMLGT